MTATYDQLPSLDQMQVMPRKRKDQSKTPVENAELFNEPTKKI
jgi:hypothetical protein